MKQGIRNNRNNNNRNNLYVLDVYSSPELLLIKLWVALMAEKIHV